MTESIDQNQSQNQSVYRFRWVGYAFLLFALLDAVLVFIPPRFNDPSWKLQILGKLVETAAIPLLGFALVFFGEYYDRKDLEKRFLSFLSWLCLALAIGFLLLIPMGVLGTIQLNSQFSQYDSKAAEQQVSRQFAPTLAQLKLFEDQLKQSKPEDIRRIGDQAKSLGITLDTQDPDQLKVELLKRIDQRREIIQRQVEQQVQQQTGDVGTKRLELNKNSFKWNLGALISATLFFILWRSTPWAR